MRSANPALPANTFNSLGYTRTLGSDAMTVQGVVLKTALLLCCVLMSAGWTWITFAKSGYNVAAISSWMIGGVIGGLVAALVTTFKKEWAAITAPIYALCQGFFIGGFSAVLEASYPGIAIQAVSLTFGTLAVMLAAYQSGLVRLSDGFKMGLVAATGGVALIYVTAIVLSFFGVQIPGIFGNGVVGIGFSIVVCAIAALNLVMDFDFIAQGARLGAPKYMEWYGAFAMMVTLVWLYIEILRLLSKLRDR
jgi:uncharacterized YccA/Bax inhibitor family protein